MRFRFMRLSIRRLFIYLFTVGFCIVIALNIHQRTLRLFTNDIRSGFNTEVRRNAGGNSPFETGKSSNDVAVGGESHPEVERIPVAEERPWYMRGGRVLPVAKSGRQVDKTLPWDLPENDRIAEQLMYMPPKGVLPEDQDNADVPLKKILLWNGIQSWGTRPGRGIFLKSQCPVSACAISTSRQDAKKADLVLFKDHFSMPTYVRPKDQLWMMFMLECPLHTQSFKKASCFNFTATYRSDSTVVAPYERWQYYNENVKQLPVPRNYAANKTKTVAWFVSNCGARNGRLKYGKELEKHVQLDIYGACGTKSCSRQNANDCFKMLEKEYKFYLAFENSNCKDYITEKFFVNGLGHDLVPIVMGAQPEDYQRVAPYKSYIHVDDFDSPADLAEYLHKLDQDDDLYNEYFKWKETGEFIDTKFFCRVCALLHNPRVEQERFFIPDFNEWWRGKGTCINGSWRKFEAAKKRESEAKLKLSTKGVAASGKSP